MEKALSRGNPFRTDSGIGFTVSQDSGMAAPLENTSNPDWGPSKKSHSARESLNSLARICKGRGRSSHHQPTRVARNPLERMDSVVPNIVYLWDRPRDFGRNRLGSWQGVHCGNLWVR